MSRKFIDMNEYFISLGIDPETINLDSETVKDYFDHNTIQEDEKEAIWKHIADLVGVPDTYDIKFILDDIKSKCEYLQVIETITKYKKSNELQALEGDWRDTDKEKRRFDRTKTRALKGLEELGIDNKHLLNVIRDKQFNEPSYRIKTKKFAQKIFKNTLTDKLTNFCRTGKDRAKNISKIIDEIKD